MQASFPNFVCWNKETRAEVMNTIALDARPSVFRSTHHPSQLRLKGIAEGRFEKIDERRYLEGFRDPSAKHVFDIAVGDSGTGKSHFIRWLYEELTASDPDGSSYHVVLVPRSSANLADVVRRILRGFDGEIALNLLHEMQSAQRLGLAGAKTRVLDEFAYVLEHDLAELFPPDQVLGDLENDILLGLPDLLRAASLRSELEQRPEGTVDRIARHVLGTRNRIEEDGPDLAWRHDDLQFSQSAIKDAGIAGDFASQFPDDDDLAGIAVHLLNRARSIALPRLLRLRRGDLLRAVAEVRREIGPNRELVLLIEDLSVTEGLDAELVEALLVRPSEIDGDACRLRSVVGVTHDDYARMRENVKEGRVRQVVHFNVPVQAGGVGGFSEQEMERFVAGYLNATRYQLPQLDAWSERLDGNPLPSACVNCPVKTTCHAAFGSVDERGLYPLSSVSLLRLYHSAAGRDAMARAFNPRLLVGRVLDRTLEDAEHSIPNRSHPSEHLRNTFGLRQVLDTTEQSLRENLRDPEKLVRLVRLVELYSPNPNEMNPQLDARVADAFQVDGAKFLAARIDLKNGSGFDPPPVVDDTKQPVAPIPDPVSRWYQGGAIDDTQLSTWRVAIVGALRAWIDWDAERLSPVRSKLVAQHIYIEGQVTKMRGTAILKVDRSVEAAGALRQLAGGLQNGSDEAAEMGLLSLRAVLPVWSDSVRERLACYLTEPGDPSPAQVAASVLALGAMLRGAVDPKPSRPDLLAAAFERWPTEVPTGRSEPWVALWRAYVKHAGLVRESLAETLACSKGGAMGTFIDASPIFQAIEHVRQNGKAYTLPDESSDWSTFENVRELAKAVNLHLEKAVEQERSASVAWLDAIGTLIDLKSPKVTLSSAEKAFDDASNLAVFDANGRLHLRDRLKGAEAAAIKKNAQLAETTRLEGSVITRLVSIGKLERDKMARSLELIQDVHGAAERSIEKTRTKINGLVQDGDLKEIEAGIHELLGRLGKALETLGQPPSMEP
jgi:hypothetical protein